MTVWTVPGVVTRVIDADTIRGTLDLGWRVFLCDQSIRVAGIDAPERGTPAGDAATAWARETLPEGTAFTLTSHSLDKYGRALGAVYVPTLGDYATLALSTGHATPYDGGKR